LPFLSRLVKEDLIEAASLFEQAIARDPRYGPALALASTCHMRLAIDGVFEDPVASERVAVALARRAMEVSGSDPVVLANSAFTLAVFGEGLAAMIALVGRALTLNPSYARGWYVSAMLQLMAGQSDLAITHAEKSLRLSPRDYLGTPGVTIGGAHFLSRRFELAANHFALALRQRPKSPWLYRYLAACYAHLGRCDEARELLKQLRVLGAPVLPSRNVYNNQAIHELLLLGLRLAMGETE
jgi:Flp pilus assembly protein TadD